MKELKKRDMTQYKHNILWWLLEPYEISQTRNKTIVTGQRVTTNSYKSSRKVEYSQVNHRHLLSAATRPKQGECFCHADEILWPRYSSETSEARQKRFGIEAIS